MNLVERTIKYCSIPSVTGDEEAMTVALIDELKTASHLQVERHGRIVIAHGPHQADRPTLALVGHTDTVPGETETRLEGERLYGLGASDMKGSLAVMTDLMLKPETHQQKLNMIGIWYDREEGPLKDATLGPFLASGQCPEFDVGICMEPTDLEIHAGCMGGMHVDVVFHGKRAHSARPWFGQNAIHMAGDFLNALSAREKVEVKIGPLTFYDVMSATLCEGGVKRNVIPDRFQININYRYSPNKNPDEAFAEVKALSDVPEYTLRETMPAGKTWLDVPLVQAFQKITACPLAAKQAWTDVAMFSVNNRPAFNFGPGLTAQAHQHNEYIMVKDLQTSADLLERFIRQC